MTVAKVQSACTFQTSIPFAICMLCLY